MKVAQRIEIRLQFRRRHCPDCPMIFTGPPAQHYHASETGHRKVLDCSSSHSRYGKRCEQASGHPGLHAYVGTDAIIYWSDTP